MHDGGGDSADFLILSEQQAEAFDAEYHSPPEMEAKIAAIRARHGDRSFNLLDLGGGNGVFADRILAAFPNAQATILDVSQALLDRNVPSNRKELVLGSIEDMETLLAGKTFDVISVNWVLHHLVGRSHRACGQNCLQTLETCRRMLSPDGEIIVAENLYQGYFESNVPSHLVYGITSVRFRPFAKLARRVGFNTAGVGVCFRSLGAWRELFGKAGLSQVDFHQGERWREEYPRKLGLRVLMIQQIRHGHFYLRKAAGLRH
mgnify:CR=1 FL=1